MPPAGPPIPTPPPEEPSVAERIQKMANYVFRNGPDFEEMMKQKEQNNPKFGFLFGGEHCQYYRYVAPSYTPTSKPRQGQAGRAE